MVTTREITKFKISIDRVISFLRIPKKECWFVWSELYTDWMGGLLDVNFPNGSQSAMFQAFKQVIVSEIKPGRKAKFEH